MKYSDLKKYYNCNKSVLCSGNKKCYSCRINLKKFKRFNNKSIRRINKSLKFREM